MKIDIVDLNKFIEINNCPKVTNPVYFSMGNTPTSDGLLSFELFGLPNSYDRRTVFGYIDLKRKFLHPAYHKMLTTLDRKINHVISGEKTFIIVDGKLKEDENGETGLDFLYKNFKKLKFQKTESFLRANKIDVIEKSTMSEIFIDKFLVMPAFYRDFDASGATKGKQDVGEFNPLYSKLINLSNSISVVEDEEGQDTGFGGINISFMSHITENKVQNTLNELYTILTQSISKKTGYIRKHLLGKSVDYATRSVISAPNFRSNTWKDQQVPINYTGIPLSQVVALFVPQMKFQIAATLTGLFEERYISYLTPEGKEGRAELVNPLDDYTPNEIGKLIELYIKSPENRYDPITVNTDKGKLPLHLHDGTRLRKLTLIDLLFMTASEVTADKHVYVTRYPVEHYQSIYPSKIKILTTYETQTLNIGGAVYEDYPKLYIKDSKGKTQKENVFYDTVVPCNSMLAALGGDYDGDTVSVRGVFSAEANAEAEKLLHSKKNLLDGAGKFIRELNNEAFQTIYALTRD